MKEQEGGYSNNPKLSIPAEITDIKINLQFMTSAYVIPLKQKHCLITATKVTVACYFILKFSPEFDWNPSG